jgi:hypothetical protein
MLVNHSFHLLSEGNHQFVGAYLNERLLQQLRGSHHSSHRHSKLGGDRIIALTRRDLTEPANGIVVLFVFSRPLSEGLVQDFARALNFCSATLASREEPLYKRSQPSRPWSQRASRKEHGHPVVSTDLLLCLVARQLLANKDGRGHPADEVEPILGPVDSFPNYPGHQLMLTEHRLSTCSIYAIRTVTLFGPSYQDVFPHIVV